ncbi:MAG TPA: thaumatin family protein [Micromonosporaceae bacterium]
MQPADIRPKHRPLRILAASTVVVMTGVAALGYGLGWFGPQRAAPPAVTAVIAVQSPVPVLSMTPEPSPSASPRSVGPSPSRSASIATHTAAPASSGTTAVPAGFRRFRFVNRTAQTIWVAGWQQTAKPALRTTGWVLPAGRTLDVTVPDHWNGRFWGRTGCSFTASGVGHCQTGDCGGRFQCKGYGGIPATLAEYNLNSFDNLDFYDVSMVDGSNLPMYINITGGRTKDRISATGCISAGCTKPVDCPSVLRVTAGAKVVGCISACARLDTDQYCCRGKWAPRADCDPTKWPVDYAAVFKKAEPYAYSYSDDDATSTFTCTGECDYRITFGLTPG